MTNIPCTAVESATLGSGFVPWPHVTFGAVTAFPAVGGGVGTAVLPDADVLSDLRVLTVVATSMD